MRRWPTQTIRSSLNAATTQARPGLLKKAIAAGKHIYCEKPVAVSLSEAVELYHYAEQQGVCHGVVQDKLWLPGLRKLQMLNQAGFFGKVLSVRGEFGYWVFEGDLQPTQRPSWNYRQEDGGGIILDMICHWRYVVDNLFGEIKKHQLPGARPIFRNVLMSRGTPTKPPLMTPPTPHLNCTMALSCRSTAPGVSGCAAMTW